MFGGSKPCTSLGVRGFKCSAETTGLPYGIRFSLRD